VPIQPMPPEKVQPTTQPQAALAFTVPPDQVTDEEFAAAQAAVKSGQPAGAVQPVQAAEQHTSQAGPPVRDSVRPLGDPAPAGSVRPGDIMPAGRRKRSFVAQPLSESNQTAGGRTEAGGEKPHIKPLKIQEERRRQRIAGEIPPIPTAEGPGDGAPAGKLPVSRNTERASKKTAFRTMLLVYAAISALGLLGLLIFLAGLIIALQSGGG